MKIGEHLELPNPNSRWVSSRDLRKVIEYMLGLIENGGGEDGSHADPQEVLNLLSFKNPVNTFNDLKTIYPNAKKGFVAVTLDTLTIYVYNGNDWENPVPEIEYATTEDIQALFNNK